MKATMQFDDDDIGNGNFDCYMQAKNMELMIWEFQQLIRSAMKHEEGRLHDAMGSIDAIHELWYELKSEYDVTECLG